MREIKYVEALNEALFEEMENDPDIVLLGEDIGKEWHGAFKVTNGLEEKFGAERVRNTPISENSFVGCGVGAAMTGLRPIVEIMFGDLILLALDQIINQAAKLRYMSGGQASVPIVIRTPFGSGGSYASHHSQSLEALFTHIPGLKVVQPSMPYDAKGLLKTGIRSIDPIMFFEHKFIYQKTGPVPKEEYTIPLGVGDIKREGSDITIIATSMMVWNSLEAAKELEKQNISVEVIDPRTLVPLDSDLIVNSVKKTGRALIVHEAVSKGGISGEITKLIIDDAFDYLDAPIRTLGGYFTPIPFSPEMEKYVVPNPNRIIKSVKKLVP
ncbi:MAG: alpha-ketoacid dehydrogenase subunit beta [Candidatus Lokiarchaeota archaeon]|nr:alpha-ketoacid dehydrogenase subunit beta [Candidatus Lokiarchaeota archaeon]